MANAKLKFNGKETPLGAGITSVGRSSDNSVAFPEDSNISRYHAEIEWRDGDFYVIDLGSSNGTTVNGERVTTDKYLSDGDEIVFGGSSSVEFVFEKDKSQPSSAGGGIAGNSGSSDEAETDDFEENETENEAETEVAEETPPDKKSRVMPGVTGAVVGLALVAVVVAGVVYYNSSTPQCDARAEITQPESGELLKNSTDIEVDSENTDCVSRAVFVLDDMIIASNENAPYQASIDPSEFPELADGLNHSLKIVLEDEEGNQIGQQSEVLLSFDTIATPTPTPDATEPTGTQPKLSPQPQQKEISLIDTKKMAENLVKQFPGSFAYKFDRRFLQDVKKKTAEYATEGYFARAQRYRDTINEAFVKEQNLDAPLGFLLAMSRSKFLPEKTPTGAGLWEMPADFASANGYDGTCEVKDLGEPTQRCAAIAAAAYMKNLALNIFEGDTVYSVASFEMSPQQASEWKDKLPENRSDFWNLMKDKPSQREEIVKFFAAGIVAENPQKFGLKKEQPISDLYRNLMAQ